MGTPFHSQDGRGREEWKFPAYVREAKVPLLPPGGPVVKITALEANSDRYGAGELRLLSFGSLRCRLGLTRVPGLRLFAEVSGLRAGEDFVNDRPFLENAN